MGTAHPTDSTFSTTWHAEGLRPSSPEADLRCTPHVCHSCESRNPGMPGRYGRGVDGAAERCRESEGVPPVSLRGVRPRRATWQSRGGGRPAQDREIAAPSRFRAREWLATTGVSPSPPDQVRGRLRFLPSRARRFLPPLTRSYVLGHRACIEDSPQEKRGAAPLRIVPSPFAKGGSRGIWGT